MDIEDLQTPVSELLLADFIHDENMLEPGKDILRRLAFERGKLKETTDSLALSLTETIAILESLDDILSLGCRSRVAVLKLLLAKARGEA